MKRRAQDVRSFVASWFKPDNRTLTFKIAFLYTLKTVYLEQTYDGPTDRWKSIGKKNTH